MKDVASDLRSGTVPKCVVECNLSLSSSSMGESTKREHDQAMGRCTGDRLGEGA